VKNLRIVLVLVLTSFILQFPAAQAWDPQPTNPFPGVAFGAEIPGYTVSVPCQGADCGIGIIPWFACPDWSASDGSDGYTTGTVKRFCRNSWTPPTSAADDEDFRNRQQLASAAATLESQAYSAAHPGEQKCVTWGPVVHANGISTASGGVCANVVGTKPDGTTAQVAPTQVGGASSNESSPKTTSGSSDSSTATSQVGTKTPTPTAPDYSPYGIGKPFTQKVAGSVSSGQCPSGFQAASNFIPGVGTIGITECWPDNAWAAYSVGGEVWQKFKTSNGSYDAQAEQTRQVQVNALRALALMKAQNDAIETIGIKRCIDWNGFGESGQECAYIPVQNNSTAIGNKLPGSTTETATATSAPADTSTAGTKISAGTELQSTRKYSVGGVTIASWESSAEYKAINCPTGSAKATGVDLNGTIFNGDDRWFTYCVQTNLNEISTSDTSTATSDTSTSLSNVDTDTAKSGKPEISNTGSSGNPGIVSTAVEISGTSKEMATLAAKIETVKSVATTINSLVTKLESSASKTYSTSIKLPVAQSTKEFAESLTPDICRIIGTTVERIKKGECLLSYTLVTPAGNSYTTQKSIVFKK